MAGGCPQLSREGQFIHQEACILDATISPTEIAMTEDTSSSLSWYLRLRGPATPESIALRFGIATPSPSSTYDVLDAIFMSRELGDLHLVLPLADGRLTHVIHVFDELVLTQAATAPTAGRTDFWAGPSLRPIVDLAREAPLALAGGGRCECSPAYADVLLGPPGWLPVVAPGHLLAFRLKAGVLDVSTVERLHDDVECERRVRENLARKIGYDDDGPRRIDLTLTLAAGRLENPHLLSEPMRPLDELLHEPTDERTPEIWRELMAWRQDNTVSFSVTGMPEALHMELQGRARHYGMSFDQFVIAVLGHLAWRTPFAEDMEPFDSWVSNPGETPPRLRAVE